MSISNNFYKLTLLSVLAFSVLVYTKISFAQEVTAPTTAMPAAGVFNPLWLLPLIAIPILLYLLWPRRRSDPMSTGYAGVKGGQAKSEEDVDVEVETKPKNRRDIVEILNSIIP